MCFKKIKEKFLNKFFNSDSTVSYIGEDIYNPIEEITEEVQKKEEEYSKDEEQYIEEHIDDPNFDVPSYIEVDIADPWKDYMKNQVRCKNGTFKEEICTLENDLVEFAGPMGDNIWLGKKVGTGEVTLVSPIYYIENRKNVYTTITVKVYNSEENEEDPNNSYISYIGK